jgi:hypothetical protein
MLASLRARRAPSAHSLSPTKMRRTGSRFAEAHQTASAQARRFLPDQVQMLRELASPQAPWKRDDQPAVRERRSPTLATTPGYSHGPARPSTHGLV